MSLARRKILVLSDGGGDDAPLQLAIDAVGAGIGTQVLVSESGAAGAEATGIEYPPIRSVVVAMIDSNSRVDKDSVS
jgi:microcompartment protein CcmK/EutM